MHIQLLIYQCISNCGSINAYPTVDLSMHIQLLIYQCRSNCWAIHAEPTVDLSMHIQLLIYPCRRHARNKKTCETTKMGAKTSEALGLPYLSFWHSRILKPKRRPTTTSLCDTRLHAFWNLTWSWCSILINRMRHKYVLRPSQMNSGANTVDQDNSRSPSTLRASSTVNTTTLTRCRNSSKADICVHEMISFRVSNIVSFFLSHVMWRLNIYIYNVPVPVTVIWQQTELVLFLGLRSNHLYVTDTVSLALHYFIELFIVFWFFCSVLSCVCYC